MTEETKQTIFDRVTNALTAYRGEDDPTRHNLLKLESPVEVKRGVPFPASNQFGYQFGHYAGSTTDYKEEAGDLMQSSLVMAVINFTATTLPEAPYHVMRIEGDGASPDLQHKLTRLMRRPNTYNSGQTMWAGFSISWWIDGNVYFHAVPSGRGEIIELWYVPHFMLEPRWPGDGRGPAIEQGHRLTPEGWVTEDEDPFISCYEYTVKNKRYWIAPEHIIHFRRLSNPNNSRKGIGAFDSVLREVYGDNARANFSAALMRNYGVARYLVTPKDGVMDEGDARANKAAFIQQTTGDNRGAPIFNTMAMDVQQLGFSPQELDLSRLGYVPESRVAAVTGIPAAVLQFMVGLENGTSYASYEQAKLQAYESVIAPIQSVILSEIDAQLLTLFDGQNPSTFSAFDTSKVRVLQEDRNKLVNRAVIAYKGEIITRARAKTWIGETVAKDGSDDVFFGQSGAPPTELPKRLQLKARKSVEWEGLTLSRQPNPVEQIAIKAISEAQESGKKRLAATLLELREMLVGEAVSGLSGMSAGDAHTLVLDAPGKMHKRVRRDLEGIQDDGRRQVVAELAGQDAKSRAFKIPIPVSRKAADDESDELDDLTSATLSRTVNDVQSRATAAALNLLTLGLAADEIDKRLKTQLDEMSTTPQEQAASAAANRALQIGRREEMEARADEIERYQYSALLDKNVCDQCAAEDGKEAKSPDDLQPAPNPECDGTVLCRCFIVAIAK